MSSFRPAARTVDPDGREWEIYAYRPKPRRRRLLPRILVSRSDEVTIEALSFAPYPLSYRWTTTREYKGNVLASVEGRLARGEIPMPRNARQILS